MKLTITTPAFTNRPIEFHFAYSPSVQANVADERRRVLAVAEVSEADATVIAEAVVGTAWVCWCDPRPEEGAA
jgi:hypothetical protein